MSVDAVESMGPGHLYVLACPVDQAVITVSTIESIT